MLKRLTLLLLAVAAVAAEIPAGAEMHVRLKTKVASTSKPGDKVEAVLIAPVLTDGAVRVPAGAIVTGEVKAAKPSKGPEDRAHLRVEFTHLHVRTAKIALPARVKDVDNAREIVEDDGRILGIVGSQTISARIDQGIGIVAERSPELALVLGVAKAAMLKDADVEIVYEPGVEVLLETTKPMRLDVAVEQPQIGTVPGDLAKLVNAQPFRTYAEEPRSPSDLTNLMFLGTEEEIRGAFKEAGWTEAAALGPQSILETVRAIAEVRGYKEAPMSVLLLDGKRADLEFQKQNNTFAMRHHLRLWRRPETHGGKPVWVSAATHDIGIDFSQESRTFIHRIEPRIDRERAKVFADLTFTGKVRGAALVERPDDPTKTSNATGDAIETDGRMAVLLLCARLSTLDPEMRQFSGSYLSG
jgi:hypothetical protein